MVQYTIYIRDSKTNKLSFELKESESQQTTWFVFSKEICFKYNTIEFINQFFLLGFFFEDGKEINRKDKQISASCFVLLKYSDY